MFTCSWKFLYVSCLRQTREMESCLYKAVSNATVLKKNVGNFQHRGGVLLWTFTWTRSWQKRLQWLFWPKILLASEFWIKLDYCIFWTLGQHYMSSSSDILCSSYFFFFFAEVCGYRGGLTTMLTTMQEDWLTIWLLWLTEKWQGQPVRSRTGGGYQVIQNCMTKLTPIPSKIYEKWSKTAEIKQ